MEQTFNNHNNNHARSGQWLVTISGFDDISFRVRSMTVPSVNLGITQLGGPGNIMVDVGGDRIMYDDLTFDFFIDEDYHNYFSMLDWVKSGVYDPKPVKDVTVYLLDNNDNIRDDVGFLFKNAWPFSLSPIIYDVENSDVAMFCNVTMKLEDMERISNKIS